MKDSEVRAGEPDVLVDRCRGLWFVRSVASLSEVVLVLHRPRNLDNVGAAARVAANFGIGQLVLVDPLSYALDRARKLAVGADGVLERLYVHRTLPEALAPAAFSAGTSSRRLARRPSLSPAALANRVAAAAGPIAIVFGDEKRGLSDAELSLCQDVCRIPTAALQPSMNLAQSVAVLSYALATVGPGAPKDGPPPATHADLAAAREEARQALSAAGFLNPQRPDLILDELLSCWARAGLSHREAELWRASFRQIEGEIRRARSRTNPG